MAKTIKGKTKEWKMFCVINSTNYNNDAEYQVLVCAYNELPDWGFDEDDLSEIDKLEMDDKYQTDYLGCYVIRIA